MKFNRMTPPTGTHAMLPLTTESDRTESLDSKAIDPACHEKAENSGKASDVNTPTEVNDVNTPTETLQGTNSRKDPAEKNTLVECVSPTKKSSFKNLQQKVREAAANFRGHVKLMFSSPKMRMYCLLLYIIW